MRIAMFTLVVAVSTLGISWEALAQTRGELAAKISELTAVVEVQLVELELLERRLAREVAAARAEAERERAARLNTPANLPSWVMPTIVTSFVIGFSAGVVTTRF